jgi:hypothetical protein
VSVHAADAQQRSVALWLFACCLLVFAMVVVGGAVLLPSAAIWAMHELRVAAAGIREPRAALPRRAANRAAQPA